MATEEQPLLEGDTSSILGRGVSVKDLSRALAALRAGALPSSEQLKAGLQALLRSPVLETEGTIWTPELGHGRIGTGKLTREGNAVRDTVRDVVSAVLVLLATRNADDQIQKLVFACRKAELDLSESGMSMWGASSLTNAPRRTAPDAGGSIVCSSADKKFTVQHCHDLSRLA